MRVGSLFSGIGGLDLGLERAGMEVRWQVEIDPYCNKVLAKHWPDVKRYGDIRKVHGEELEPVDLITGGFPCQPVSHAGRRLGESDDRFLWPEMLRLIREVKPAYVLGENVFGLVTHDEGALLASIVADLEDAGYEVAPPVVFPAAAVGALHRRDRVWLVAHTNGERRQQVSRSAPRDEGTDGWQQDGHHQPQGRSEGVAYADEIGREWWAGEQRTRRRSESSDRREEAIPSDAICERGCGRHHHREDATDARQFAGGEGLRQWDVEPDVGRVAHGVPSRVDRLRALGNGVVPQVAEFLGRRIMEVSRESL